MTIGPRGQNVGIEQGTTPIIANDAGVIARHIELKEPTENMGAQIIKDVIQDEGGRSRRGKSKQQQPSLQTRFHVKPKSTLIWDEFQPYGKGNERSR